MKITIKFYSNWAIGSGKGGESKDSIILKDKNGLPFIPGRTLKGLIRDAFIECGFKKDDEIRLFGQIKTSAGSSGLQDGILRFNSAYLPVEYQGLEMDKKTYLFDTRTSTRVDNKKQAIDHSLRKNEVIIPLELETTIVLKENNKELENGDYEKIEKALKMLKIMGENRHRGLGRCKITVEKQNETTEENKQDNKTITNNVVIFRCIVTEPLILLRKSKTEQNVKSLDYLPGSIFRGIVAGTLTKEKLNNKFDDIIFNGKVQFGDAHLVIKNKKSYKIPFSFFIDKSKPEMKTFYNFHHLKNEDWIDKKLKNKKDGYFVSENGKIIFKDVEFGSRLKSSRDYEKRSSENGGMFYYHYIDKGQSFEFQISSDDTNYLNEIINILDEKTKYFGKSKGAEFGGAIKIEYLKSKDKETPKTNGKYLYAESNLCFLNEYGEFTAHPTEADLGVSNNAKIDWENSQIKFRTYFPYNQHRQNWDAERLIIEKGSVIAFREEVEFYIEKIHNGLGCFLTEGFGKVLINPEFLDKKVIEYEKYSNNNSSISSRSVTEIDFIEKKHQEMDLEIKIDTTEKKYQSFSKKTTNSQWGRIFNATTRANNYEELKSILFGNENNNQEGRDQSIFYGGKNKWDENDINKIKNFLQEDGIVNNEVKAIRKLAKINQSKNQ